jgi:Zn-dependent peptidase ImmA (M78 family)
MQRIWAAEQAASFTTQLLPAIKFKVPRWANAVPTGKPTPKTALSLRKYFDDWFARRRAGLGLSGTAEQTFFAALRIFIEAQGTLVRVNDAPAEDYLGFFLDDNQSISSIFINRRTSAPKAQLFTIVHEIAHRMLGVSGVSDPFQLNNDIERTCNKFAAEFLAPEEAFRAIVERQNRSARSDVFMFVDAVSQQSLLSKHATAIRLLETDYLNPKQLGAWTNARAAMNRRDLKQEESDASGETFGQPHAKRIGEVGYLSTFAAKLAVDMKFIDYSDVISGISLSRTLQERAFSLAARRMEVAVSE